MGERQSGAAANAVEAIGALAGTLPVAVRDILRQQLSVTTSVVEALGRVDKALEAVRPLVGVSGSWGSRLADLERKLQEARKLCEPLLAEPLAEPAAASEGSAAKADGQEQEPSGDGEPAAGGAGAAGVASSAQAPSPAAPGAGEGQPSSAKAVAADVGSADDVIRGVATQ